MHPPLDSADAVVKDRRDAVLTNQPSSVLGRLALGQVWRQPLPALGWSDRLLVRGINVFSRRQIRAVHGLENLTGTPDPMVVALNHSIRRETVLVIGLLVFLRGGRLIHIWSNWVFNMVPGLAWMLRRAGTMAVVAKPPRIKLLNRLKDFYVKPQSALDQARNHLVAGRTVGVFPEGSLSPDPRRLLSGHIGMARLSLMTGVPVVPVGIRFPDADLDMPIPESAIMEVHVGAPLRPPAITGPRPGPAVAREWHAAVMTRIAELSGRSWEARAKGRDRHVPAAEA